MATPPTPSWLNFGCLADGRILQDQQNNQFLSHRVNPNDSRLPGHISVPGSSPPTGETDVLTFEFSKLSLQEQSQALSDIHHAGELQEDPVMIDKLLQDFEQEVGRSKCAVYEQALKKDRSYVEDPGFRLKFLRANMHDVPKAVKQMFSFLKHKAKYFGNDKVASDITINDLTPEELKILLSGIYHIQEGTDKNGRVILHYFSKAMPSKIKVESMIRVHYFIYFNCLVSMHSVQKKGVLVVAYDLSKANEKVNSIDLRGMMRVINFMSSMPIRYTANHICLKRVEGSVSWNNVMLGISIKAYPKHARERTCVHYGSDTELQYQLANYGIPLDTFPVDMDGNVRTGIMNAWFYQHLEREGGVKNNLKDDASISDQEDGDDGNSSASSRARVNGGQGQPNNRNNNNNAPSTVIDGIWESDVLLGRGRLVQYHPGNINFREFLDDHIEDYESLARNQRRRACSDLARELVAHGTRFLKQTETDLWVVCEFEEIVDKVAQFYRTRRRRDQQQQQRPS